MTIAEWVKEQRNKLGITQNELSYRIYVSRVVISYWETGRRIPEKEMLERLESVFGVPYRTDEVIR